MIHIFKSSFAEYHVPTNSVIQEHNSQFLMPSFTYLKNKFQNPLKYMLNLSFIRVIILNFMLLVEINLEMQRNDLEISRFYWRLNFENHWSMFIIICFSTVNMENFMFLPESLTEKRQKMFNILSFSTPLGIEFQKLVKIYCLILLEEVML